MFYIGCASLSLYSRHPYYYPFLVQNTNFNSWLVTKHTTRYNNMMRILLINISIALVKQPQYIKVYHFQCIRNEKYPQETR